MVTTNMRGCFSEDERNGEVSQLKGNVQKYNSIKEDVERASKSVVETTFDGENIPLIQQHIVDVGFVAFHVARLDGDNVILQYSGTNEVLSVLK